MTTMMMRWSSLFLPIALVLLAGAAADGECGAARPDHLALKLAPCASAVEDPGSAPSASCCAAVRDVGRRHSPGCLCTLLLSDTVRHSGVDLDAVITIPKRCDLATRAPSATSAAVRSLATGGSIAFSLFCSGDHRSVLARVPFFAEYTLPGLHE